MPQTSGVQNAIRELEQEQQKIEEAISMLKSIHSQRSSGGESSAPAAPRGTRRKRRRLSADARRRISEAAKKRWAALRGSKQGSKK
jgi:hypothetical protein